MQNTHDLEALGGALIDLVGFLNSPQRDTALLREAQVEIDRALFPLLVAIGARGAPTVAEIADLVGRDSSTISRQLARLNTLALIVRDEDDADRRRSRTRLTDRGRAVVEAIGQARRRLLSAALADWNEDDLTVLAGLSRRLVTALADYTVALRV